jgi:hypothetical protein
MHHSASGGSGGCSSRAGPVCVRVTHDRTSRPGLADLRPVKSSSGVDPLPTVVSVCFRDVWTVNIAIVVRDRVSCGSATLRIPKQDHAKAFLRMFSCVIALTVLLGARARQYDSAKPTIWIKG